MRAIAFSPSGSLFGATKGGLLLRIDPETGDTSAIGSSTGITYSSLSFSPSGVLYASVQPPIANRDAIYRVDTSNGSTTLVGKTGDNAVTPAIAFDGSGRLYGLKGTGTQQNTLIMIDTLNAQGTVIGPTGTTGLQAMIMRTDVAVAVGEPDGIPPLAFALLQNYPNPFNPTTMIEYTLPRAGYATLRVYTVLGEEVATLIDREHAPGTFKASWDASAMPSGIYFYRLSAGEHVQTRKMTLIR
jgi:hypothetical protein